MSRKRGQPSNPSKRKLHIEKETVRILSIDSARLAHVVGGESNPDVCTPPTTNEPPDPGTGPGVLPKFTASDFCFDR